MCSLQHRKLMSVNYNELHLVSLWKGVIYHGYIRPLIMCYSSLYTVVLVFNSRDEYLTVPHSHRHRMMKAAKTEKTHTIITFTAMHLKRIYGEAAGGKHESYSFSCCTQKHREKRGWVGAQQSPPYRGCTICLPLQQDSLGYWEISKKPRHLKPVSCLM